MLCISNNIYLHFRKTQNRTTIFKSKHIVTRPLTKQKK